MGAIYRELVGDVPVSVILISIMSFQARVPRKMRQGAEVY